MPDTGPDRFRVVVVGGGFAGVGCVRRLARDKRVRVTLLDRNNYHQFQPLLYQVATSQLAASNIAYSLRKLFRNDENVLVRMDEVAEVDPATRTAITTGGERHTGDVLVLAAGSRPNFFHTAGAQEHTFPLYSLVDAERLRSRIIGVFEAADRDPGLIDRGALNFVVVGGGPTGVEMAGALADLIEDTMGIEYHDLAVAQARIHLIDLGDVLLGPFSGQAHDYVAKVLTRKGVHLHLGTAVTEVGPGRVTLSDGSTIDTRCVIWGGGIMAPEVAGADALPHGHGGRVEVWSDLTVDGENGVYAVGDVANIPGPGGRALPQLGSVALQSGAWAAENIIAGLDGRPRRAFRYRDKGIMAMIGRGAALAEVGPRRRRLHGLPAFCAWLGVHAILMTGVRNRIETFIDWGWDYFSRSRGPQVLDRAAAAQIDWGDDGAPDAAREGASQQTTPA
jgi:NADH:ubiquinone reductase (H+-translocating)